MTIRDGQLQGANLLKLIEQARAMAAEMRGRPASSQPASSDVTPFATLTASATIAGGVARNTDLVLESSTLQATGSGTADLERATLEYCCARAAAGRQRDDPHRRHRTVLETQLSRRGRDDDPRRRGAGDQPTNPEGARIVVQKETVGPT